ncbi:MAG: ChrR family anti-sigma-E factor [Spongiibacteraceae bacterium]
MTNHHPAPELLTAFSAGSLQLSHALCVSTHIDHCQECRSNLQRLDTIGAHLLEILEPAQPSNHLKQRVLAALDNPTTNKPAATINTANSTIPHALRQFVSSDYHSLRWRYLSPSIQKVKLHTDSRGQSVELLRIKPGGKAATHTHTGDEYTVILEGSFSDETGIYTKGDFILRNTQHKHRPIATKDQECICLTVTDAPIAFTGFFTRWLNPLLS